MTFAEAPQLAPSLNTPVVRIDISRIWRVYIHENECPYITFG